MTASEQTWVLKSDFLKRLNHPGVGRGGGSALQGNSLQRKSWQSLCLDKHTGIWHRKRGGWLQKQEWTSLDLMSKCEIDAFVQMEK